MLSKFPTWSQIDSIPKIRDDNVESPPSHDDEEPFPVTTLPGDGTSTMAEPIRVPRGQQECRPRGRPPKINNHVPQGYMTILGEAFVEIAAKVAALEAGHRAYRLLAKEPLLDFGTSHP